MGAVDLTRFERMVFAIGSFMQKIKPFKKAFGEVSLPIKQAMKRYEDAINRDVIKSDNESINKLWAVAKCWRSEMNPFVSEDENFWIERSDVDLFKTGTFRPAVEKLEALIETFTNLKSAAEGCIGLIYALDVTDHMNVKGWGSMLVSTKMLDIEARKQAVREFRDCMEMADKILQVLKRSLAALQRFEPHA